jgi:hypothetical protein
VWQGSRAWSEPTATQPYDVSTLRASSRAEKPATRPFETPSQFAISRGRFDANATSLLSDPINSAPPVSHLKLKLLNFVFRALQG